MSKKETTERIVLVTVKARIAFSKAQELASDLETCAIEHDAKVKTKIDLK